MFGVWVAQVTKPWKYAGHFIADVKSCISVPKKCLTVGVLVLDKCHYMKTLRHSFSNYFFIWELYFPNI